MSENKLQVALGVCVCAFSSARKKGQVSIRTLTLQGCLCTSITCVLYSKVMMATTSTAQNNRKWYYRVSPWIHMQKGVGPSVSTCSEGNVRWLGILSAIKVGVYMQIPSG